MAQAAVSETTPLDDPSRAADVGGKTHALEGGVVGLIAGAVVVALFTLWGDLATNPVGLIVGAIGVVGGMAAIGFVVGRTMGRHASAAQRFVGVVPNGGAIVSVQCTDQEGDLAAQVLDGADAREVRDEAGPEAV
jgi:hypothetical protein